MSVPALHTNQPDPVAAAALGRVRDRLTGFYPAGLRDACATGSPAEATARCYGDPWRLVTSLTLDHSLAPDQQRAHLAVLTDNTVWAATLYDETVRHGSPGWPKNAETRFAWANQTPDLRMREIMFAITMNSLGGTGLTGLLNTIGDRAAESRPFDTSLWVRLAEHLLTGDMPADTATAAEITNTRFLFALAPHTDLYRRLTEPPDPPGSLR